jgi:hypothetical protein
MTTDLNEHVTVTTGDGDIVLMDKRTGSIIALEPKDVRKLEHVARREG